MPHNHIPVGTVIASMLPWPLFERQMKEHSDKWFPADGRPLPKNTKYYKILSDHGIEATLLPDLRGRFVRGLNSFVSDQGEIDSEIGNPDKKDNSGKNFVAGSFQVDGVGPHTHDIPTRYGQIDGAGYLSRGIDLDKDNVRTLENLGSPETRPRNVSLYHYIKVN